MDARIVPLNLNRHFGIGTQIKMYTLGVACTGQQRVVIPPDTLIDNSPIVGLSIANITEVSQVKAFNGGYLDNITNEQFLSGTLNLVRKSITLVESAPFAEFNRSMNNGQITPLDCIIIDAQQSYIEFSPDFVPDDTKAVSLTFYYLDAQDRLLDDVLNTMRKLFSK